MPLFLNGSIDYEGASPLITPNYKGENPFIIPQKTKRQKRKEQKLLEEEKRLFQWETDPPITPKSKKLKTENTKTTEEEKASSSVPTA